MFDFLTLPKSHAISILKKDHDRVKQLFDEYEKADGRVARQKIVREAVTELKIHAILEEEIFYPAVREHVGAEQMNEADEEHHVAKVLIAELDAGVGDEGHRDAKFTVLGESIRHHIKEEEDEVLPKAKSMDLDFVAIGERMLARKKQLLAKGIPADAEHAMVKRAGTDSPAKAARKTTARRTVARKSAAKPNTRAAH
jgi:hemerythrin HHE cation binding domain-containing protein